MNYPHVRRPISKLGIVYNIKVIADAVITHRYGGSSIMLTKGGDTGAYLRQ